MKNEKFKFECKKECGAQCCNSDTFVRSYDLYRLARHYNIKLKEALNFCEMIISKETGIPELVLKKDKRTEKCIFLKEGWRCSIYFDRPGSCRLYPVVITKDKYLTVYPSGCPGFDTDKEQTLSEWIDGEPSIFIKYEQLFNMLLEHLERNHYVKLIESSPELNGMFVHLIYNFKESLSEMIERFNLRIIISDLFSEILVASYIFLKIVCGD